MTTVKLNDEIYKELHVLKKSEWGNIGKDYKGTAIFDKGIKTAFFPGYGTVLFFENKHFLIVGDNAPLKKYAIWRNHHVIGYCEISKAAADKANKATNAVFYFGFDKTIAPEKYN